ncbi:MAG: dihydroneopterin aldolase [Pseudomonadota bacterium]
MISLLSKVTSAPQAAPQAAPTDHTAGAGGHTVRYAKTEPAQNRRQMFLRDLVLETEIGAYPEERNRTQRVRFNINALVEDRPVTQDDLAGVVSYELLRDAAHRVTDMGHTNLVETMAERLASMCLNHPAIVEIMVRVEKLDVFDDCEAAGVEITRRRQAPEA